MSIRYWTEGVIGLRRTAGHEMRIEAACLQLRHQLPGTNFLSPATAATTVARNQPPSSVR